MVFQAGAQVFNAAALVADGDLGLSHPVIAFLQSGDIVPHHLDGIVHGFVDHVRVTSGVVISQVGAGLVPQDAVGRMDWSSGSASYNAECLVVGFGCAGVIAQLSTRLVP